MPTLLRFAAAYVYLIKKMNLYCLLILTDQSKAVISHISFYKG